MAQLYSRQPTLLLGLGGYGSRAVRHVCNRIKDECNAIAYYIDTDLNDLKDLPADQREHFISLASTSTISEMLSHSVTFEQWFPKHPLLNARTVTEGAGQVRAAARLAYEFALRAGRFKPLLEGAYKMAQSCLFSGSPMRISIVTSLVGGTGSGIFIQIALLLRRYLTKRFPSLKLQIHGEFILPANFLFLSAFRERRFVEAITYASLKELHAINAHFFANGPAVELPYAWDDFDQCEISRIEAPPYDSCFLYDKINRGTIFSGRYIEDAIYERLFGKSADALYTAFLKENNPSSGHLFGIVNTETLPANASLLDSELYCSMINRANQSDGKGIFALYSSQRTRIDTALFPKDTVLLEISDDQAKKTVITELHYGIELGKLEKMKHQTGQYYRSYKESIDLLPRGITPHLHKDWHTTLADIQATSAGTYSAHSDPAVPRKIPEDSFVFISYSTKEIAVAEQTRQVLSANGIPCWMAPQSIPAGSDYGTEIPKAIGNCKAFLLLLSQASQDSNWVPKEIGQAIGKGKIVVPFQIDDAAINDAFNFYLTNSQRISAYNRMADAYQELVKRLIDILI